jgi:prephenate dehydrogenase
VALIGTGLIGGSIGLGLKARGLAGTVVGWDARPEAGAAAHVLGIVDEVARDAAAAAKGADLVIVAVPVRATSQAFSAIAPGLSSQAVVTDVGSTKMEPVAAARALPFSARFVGAHPMAGTERSGPEAAQAGLFLGRLCLLTPIQTSDPDAVDAVTALWRGLGATIVTLTPERHDDVVAAVSHLPHVAAFALAEAVGGGREGETCAGLSGGGFVDTTRIAASDPTMWRDVFLSNRGPVLAAIGRLTGELEAFRDAIDRADGEALTRLIARARAARQRVLERRT